MNEYLMWYLIIYLIELITLIIIVKQSILEVINKVTVGDIMALLIIPALVIILPVIIIAHFYERINNIVIWRKK